MHERGHTERCGTLWDQFDEVDNGVQTRTHLERRRGQPVRRVRPWIKRGDKLIIVSFDQLAMKEIVM